MILYLRKPRPGDPALLAHTARQADREEIVGLSGVPVTTALMNGFSAPGEAWVVADQFTDWPLIAFGVVEHMPGTGCAWLIGSDLTQAQGRLVLRHGGGVLDALQARWPILMNTVAASNRTHVRWLRKNGFVLHTFTERYGATGVPAFTFYRTRNV